MLKKTVTNRASWRRLVGALGALGIGLAAASAFADVVLIPGTVNGTVSFGNWAYTGGSVSISGAGDPNNSYGSIGFSGSTFALVVPGGLTYKNQSISLNKYDSATNSQQYASFSPNIDVAVPSGGSVDVIFSQEAGFIAPTVALTGGTIVSSEFAAQNYANGKYSSGSAYGNSASLP